MAATVSYNYQGQTVLITGAAGGIGLAAARAFGDAGANLVLCDVDEGRLRGATSELAEQGFPHLLQECDVTSASQGEALVAAAVEGFGRLDIAINNAGVEHAHVRMGDITEQEFDRVMAVNTKGVFLGMKYQLQQMREQQAGVILNVSSISGLIASPTLAAYSASKHAVLGLTKTAAVEYARFNIRINSLCPGLTDTEMVARTLEEMGDDREASMALLTRDTPMRRPAEPEEMAQVMLWACSDANRYMTGQSLTADGGTSL